MNQWDLSLETAAWETAIAGLQPGDRFSAAQLLTLLEEDDDLAAEEALQALESGGITLDISQIPRHTAPGEAALRLKQEEQLAAKGDFLMELEDSDPLRLYLEELAAIPAAGDVDVLSQDAAAGSDSARMMLVNLMLSRVVELAREHVGYGVLLLDLIQEGGMGLWQAVLSWNGDGHFRAYADWWICQSMAGLILRQARSNGVGQRMRQAMEDYRDADEKLLTELGRNPTLEEIADQLHISQEEASALAETMAAARMIDRIRPQEQQPLDAEEEQTVENTAYFQMRQRIADLLSGLTEQDAKLLTLRFGLEGGIPMSPAETGKQLGITSEEVVEREAAVLAVLRNNG